MKRKRDYEKVVRSTVSMPPELHRFAVKIQSERHFNAFSDVFQDLLREKMQSHGR